MNAAHSIDAPVYLVAPAQQDDDSIIARALAILAARIKAGPLMGGPREVREYLTMQAAKHNGREVFSVLFLDAQNRVIEFRELFFGTLTQTSVYPREVVRAAIEINSASIILTHNHPSGNTQPSRADELLTSTLKTALALVDVRVLDHIITAGGQSLSMAERGLI
jgi:DNA repair protein RadC